MGIQFATSAGEVGANMLKHPGIFFQGKAEQVRRNFAGDVIAGRTQPARDQNDVTARNRFHQRQADFVAVGNADLPLDAQSQLEQLTAQPVGMRVQRLAEQQFGAGIDQVNAHARQSTRFASPHRSSSAYMARFSG